jgi:tellurite resistance protein
LGVRRGIEHTGRARSPTLSGEHSEASIHEGEHLILPAPQSLQRAPQYTARMKIVKSDKSAKPAAGTPSNAGVTVIGAARPWLARLPPGLFAMVFGLLGLAGTWRRLTDERVLDSAEISAALLTGATSLLELLLLLYLLKWIRHRDEVAKDFAHPVSGAMLSLAPLSTLLAVALWIPSMPQWTGLATGIAAAALSLQAVIAWRVVARIATNDLPSDLITPALYLPPVGGGLIGALALAALGYHGLAVLLFGMGVGAWALLETRVLNRLFAGPLPPPLRATIGVELAPVPVSTLVALALWPTLPADVWLVGIGISCAPLVAVLARWRWWSAPPFSVGFWSFSFPIAALASVVIEAVQRGGWPASVATAAALLASALIAYLTVRTVILVVQGRLLPTP